MNIKTQPRTVDDGGLTEISISLCQIPCHFVAFPEMQTCRFSETLAEMLAGSQFGGKSRVICSPSPLEPHVSFCRIYKHRACCNDRTSACANSFVLWRGSLLSSLTAKPQQWYEFYRNLQTNNGYIKENRWSCGDIPATFRHVSVTSQNLVCAIGSCQPKLVPRNATGQLWWGL